MECRVTSNRQDRVLHLLRRALQQSADERRRFLERECGGDQPLVFEVERLLNGSWEESREALEGIWSPQTDTLVEVENEFDAERVSESRLGDLHDPWIGRRVGIYRIVKRLGDGEHGTVYLAEREDEFNQRVALKFLTFRLRSAQELDRFNEGCRALAELDSPFVARLLGSGLADDEVPFLAMEHIEGEPIDVYCDLHELNVANRLRLFLSVLKGVSHAHARLMLHCGLKPNNILVTSGGVPKVLDFGVSRLAETEWLEPMLRGTLRRHPDFLAPEQVLGEPLTTASDVYSLAVILYQLLTGHLPYPGKATAMEMLEKICGEAPDPASQAVARVEEMHSGVEGLITKLTPETVSRPREGAPEKLRRRLEGDLDAILAKALRKEVGARYRSADELAADVERHLQFQPVAQVRQDARYLAVKFVRRHFEVAIGAVVAVVAMAVLTLVSLGHTWAAAKRVQDAEGQLEAARGFMEYVVDDRLGEPAQSAGLTERDSRLLDRLDAVLGALPPASDESSFSPAHRAGLYLRIGDVRRALPSANSVQAASADYSKALALVSGRVSSGRGGSPLDRLAYAAALGRQGEIESLLGERAKAWDSYRQSLDILKDLVEANPGNLQAHRELAERYRAMGTELAQHGNIVGSPITDAQEAFSRAMAEDDAILVQDAGNSSARWEAASTAIQLANYNASQGESGKAMRTLREALASLVNLPAAELHSESSVWWRGLLHRHLAALLALAPQTVPESLEQYQQAETLLRNIAARRPEENGRRSELAQVLVARGALYSDAGRSADALRDLDEAFEIWRSPGANDGNAPAPADIAAAQLLRANALASLGDRAKARDEGRLAMAVLASAADRERTGGSNNERFARALLDTRLDGVGDPRRAMHYARRAVDLSGGRKPAFLATLVRAQAAAGDKQAAVQTANQALAMLPPDRPGEAPSALRAQLEESLRVLQPAARGAR